MAFTRAFDVAGVQQQAIDNVAGGDRRGMSSTMSTSASIDTPVEQSMHEYQLGRTAQVDARSKELILQLV